MSQQAAVTGGGRSITIDVPVAPGTWVETAKFEARAREARTDFARDASSRQGLRQALDEIAFADQAGARWRFTGVRWERQEGARWIAAPAPAMLALLPFQLEALFTEDDAPIAGQGELASPEVPPSRWSRLLALPDEPTTPRPAAAATAPPAASPPPGAVRCAACAAEITPGHRFCRACGAPSPCAGCGAALVPGHRFCAKCGAPAPG